MVCSDRNTMEAVPANCLRDVWSYALQACVIGIDEGQFVSINSFNVFSTETESRGRCGTDFP